MRFCIALVILALIPVTAQAEFIVKYHIDGHIYVPPGPTGGEAACVAEMDGDPSSPEILVLSGQDNIWTQLGIANLTTGVTQWLPFVEVGQLPLQIWAYGGGPFLLRPLFTDVDADGLVDVLVPVDGNDDGNFRTAVIGWDGTAAAGKAPQRSVARLSAANPNPSRSSVSFEYFIPQRSHVEFRVLDVSGRLVCTLVDDEVAAGPHAIAWDGSTDAGTQAEVGSYFYVLKVNGVRVAERSSVLVR